MSNLMNLKDFELSHKDRSIESLSKWRSAVWLVKNPRRRFRWVADLVKRKHAEDKLRKLQVFSLFSFFLTSASVLSPKRKLLKKLGHE